jgi:hypothetical protein
VGDCIRQLIKIKSCTINRLKRTKVVVEEMRRNGTRRKRRKKTPR